MAFRIQPEVMAEIQRLAADSPDPRGLLSSFERLGNALPGTPSKEVLSLLARLFELPDFLPKMLSPRPALGPRPSRRAPWEREKPPGPRLREAAPPYRANSQAA